jgi:hypothetical protein
MRRARRTALLLGLALVCVTGAGGASPQGVRVVDAVNVTVLRDETSHAMAGDDTTLGEAAGRKWRSATGWFSYSLHIYDDSPLTLVFAFADGDGNGGRESFDVLVDGRKVASYTREGHESRAAEVRVSLALAETAGKTAVVVKLQAHAGARTARLLEVRSVQEHLEWAAATAGQGGPFTESSLQRVNSTEFRSGCGVPSPPGHRASVPGP